MEFVEAPAFTRHVYEYLAESDYVDLQNRLAGAPLLGRVMPGTGGFRKLRWADPKRGKGRRGGLRVIYYYFPIDSQIWMVTLFDKDEAADLTPREKEALKTAIERELRARKAAKGTKPGRPRRQKA